MDGESGGGSHPSLLPRSSTKRTFDNMSASHRSSPPFHYLAPRDGDYTDEQSWRRRRRAISHSPPSEDEQANPTGTVRYPGDGFDYRRPVTTAPSSTAPRRNDDRVNASSADTAAVIDLTDEDGTQESQGGEPAPSAAPVASSSRAQRLPRFGRDIFDLDDLHDLEASESDTSHLPGAHYLARRPAQWARSNRGRRPHHPSLRRLARPPSPSPATEEDEVQFVAERTLANASSRQPTPQIPPPPTRNAPRSVTPYPTGVMDGVIDLTADGDDDLILLNARQRAGNNGEGAPNVADPTPPMRGYAGIGQIANMIRDSGVLGGRLMQRIQGFGFDALDAELRAMGQARDHYEHNHGQQQRRAAEHRPAPRVPEPPARFPRAGGGMAIMMDYNMTGFDLGLAGGNRPATPKYQPPPPPEKGFTRSPEEDEVVVCPNCGDELAVGEEEAKQEIWVIKTCGHAYCGDCAQNRAIKPKSAKKGKGMAPFTTPTTGFNGPAPFKLCVVDGCAKPAAKNSMIRIYLGT